MKRFKHRGRDVHPDAPLGLVRGRADVWRAAEAGVFNQRMTCANRFFFEHIEGKLESVPLPSASDAADSSTRPPRAQLTK